MHTPAALATARHAPTVPVMSLPASAEEVLIELRGHGVPDSDLSHWQASPYIDLAGMLTLLEPPHALGLEGARRIVDCELPAWVVTGYLDRGYDLDSIITLWRATTQSALLMLGLAEHLGPSLSIETIDYLSRLGVPLMPLMLKVRDWTEGSPVDGPAARLALAHWLLYESDVSQAHRFASLADGQAWVETATRLTLDGMKIDAAIEAAHRLEGTPASKRVRIHAGKDRRVARERA